MHRYPRLGVVSAADEPTNAYHLQYVPDTHWYEGVCMLHQCTQVCMHVCMYVCMDERMDGWMDGWMDGLLSLLLLLLMYVYIYIYIYIYIHIHTYMICVQTLACRGATENLSRH